MEENICSLQFEIFFCLLILGLINPEDQGRIERSVVKNTDCSSREPRFYSQPPDGVSQPLLILMSGHLTPSPGIDCQQKYMCYIAQTYMQKNIYTHKNKWTNIFTRLSENVLRKHFCLLGSHAIILFEFYTCNNN